MFSSLEGFSLEWVIWSQSSNLKLFQFDGEVVITFFFVVASISCSFSILFFGIDGFNNVIELFMQSRCSVYFPRIELPRLIDWQHRRVWFLDRSSADIGWFTSVAIHSTWIIPTRFQRGQSLQALIELDDSVQSTQLYPECLSLWIRNDLNGWWKCVVNSIRMEWKWIGGRTLSSSTLFWCFFFFYIATVKLRRNQVNCCAVTFPF